MNSSSRSKNSARCGQIAGADPRLEIGAITEIAAGRADSPALLFDDIKGFPRGFRIFTNAATSPQRAALALGIDPHLGRLDTLKAWIEKRKTLKPQAPLAVKDAPFLRHAAASEAVDLRQFPAPIWHRHDGGPFIGSGSLVIMRDPEDGWINASIYRIQVQDERRVTVQFDHAGRHGAIIAQKYWEREKPCPVAVVHGEDPALFVAGFEYLPAGHSEYEFAGAIRGTPIEVCPGPQTGLPLPAHAEIIFEGHLLPTSETTMPEGPFGEFTGYYASEARPAPVMEVTATYHRRDLQASKWLLLLLRHGWSCSSRRSHFTPRYIPRSLGLALAGAAVLGAVEAVGGRTPATPATRPEGR